MQDHLRNSTINLDESLSSQKRKIKLFTVLEYSVILEEQNAMDDACKMNKCFYEGRASVSGMYATQFMLDTCRIGENSSLETLGSCTAVQAISIAFCSPFRPLTSPLVVFPIKMSGEPPDKSPPLRKNLLHPYFESLPAATSSEILTSYPHHLLSAQGEPALKIPQNLLESLSKPFKFTLVGKFSHGRPSMERAHQIFAKLRLKGAFSLGHLDPKDDSS